MLVGGILLGGVVPGMCCLLNIGGSGFGVFQGVLLSQLAFEMTLMGRYMYIYLHMYIYMQNNRVSPI